MLRLQLIENLLNGIAVAGAEKTAFNEYGSVLIHVVFAKCVHVDKIPQFRICMIFGSFVQNVFRNVRRCCLRDQIEVIKMFRENS